jgi:hypothetical protein
MQTTYMYAGMGARVCAELTQLTDGNPTYADADYLVAAYDALSTATKGESPAELTDRAHQLLLAQAALAGSTDPAAHPDISVSPHTNEHPAHPDYALCQSVVAQTPGATERFLDRYQDSLWRLASKVISTIRYPDRPGSIPGGFLLPFRAGSRVP